MKHGTNSEPMNAYHIIHRFGIFSVVDTIKEIIVSNHATECDAIDAYAHYVKLIVRKLDNKKYNL